MGLLTYSWCALLPVALVCVACGGDEADAPGDNGGAGGTGGTGGAAGGGAGGTGAVDAGHTGGYSSLLGVPPGTRLDTLEPDSFVIACQAYNLYFNEQIPQADQVRAVCVENAVLGLGAGTVADCTAASDACIEAVPGFPPPPCVAPDAALEECPTTVDEFETCLTDLTARQKERVDLLVCESLEVPDIQTMLAEASEIPDSCVSFADECPAFFPAPPPPPPPPDGGTVDGG